MSKKLWGLSLRVFVGAPNKTPQQTLRATRNFFIIIFLVLCLTACGRVVLYNDLTQEDANKVMVLLQQNGIQAELAKETRQNETFWSVKVDQEMLAKARELIVSGNVISPRSPGLQEVYQAKGSSGWIRTPAEERARYLLAQKGEIINSLKKLPDVVDVDVVLNLPEQDELGRDEKKHPTASIVIKAQTAPKGQASLSELKVQEFVANSVEGMSARDVAVIINYMAPTGTTLRPGETVTLPKPGDMKDSDAALAATTTPVRLMGLKLDTDSRDRLKIYLIVFFVVLIILSVFLVVSIIQASRMRQELKAIKGGGAHAALEGQVMEGGTPRRLPQGTREPRQEG